MNKQTYKEQGITCTQNSFQLVDHLMVQVVTWSSSAPEIPAAEPSTDSRTTLWMCKRCYRQESF